MQIFKQSAHSISEYGLILGLLVIMLIGFLSSMGGTINGTYDKTVLAMSLAPQRPEDENRTTQGLPTEIEPNPIPLNDPRYAHYRIQKLLDESPTQIITLNDGKKISIPNPDLSSLQETLGPSGSTDLVQALVQRMITELKKADANPEVIAELSEFANKTHMISKSQKVRETDLLGHVTSDLNSRWKDQAYLDLIFDEKLRQTMGGTLCPDCVSPDSKFSLKDGELYFEHFGTQKPVSDLTYVYELRARGFYTAQVLEQKNLGHLNQVFLPISEHLVRSSETFEEMVRAVDHSEKNYDFYFKNGTLPTWLSTRVNANKVCTLSKDNQCLK